jgi:hypothetical protein
MSQSGDSVIYFVTYKVAYGYYKNLRLRYGRRTFLCDLFANERRQLKDYTAKQKLVWSTARTSVDHDVTSACVFYSTTVLVYKNPTSCSNLITQTWFDLPLSIVTVILITQIRHQLSVATG